MTTKEPRWDEEKKSFKLKLSISNLRPSVNNFILQNNARDYMEFGKVGEGEYRLKLENEMDYVKGFAIAVSALSFKWICV